MVTLMLKEAVMNYLLRFFNFFLSEIVFLCKWKMLHKKPVKRSYVIHVHFINIFTMLHDNNCTSDVRFF